MRTVTVVHICAYMLLPFLVSSSFLITVPYRESNNLIEEGGLERISAQV
jgi:hypothetical protein